jgi:prolyl-tRNA synthetase
MGKSLPKKTENFSEWYNEVIAQAELAEHSPVKGSMTILPYGFSIWERIQAELDRRLKELGVQNAYFPLFIPQSFIKREKEHLEGFSPELAVVTYAGGKELSEPYIVRPTSETIIYEAYSRWISSYRDLPFLINQWVNVVRWELRPRLFLRTTEFLWQEGHTAHASLEEADRFALRILQEVYQKFLEEVLALSVVAGLKSESQKFAGAQKTYTVEVITAEGKALQMGTSHNLADNFARVFNITYLDAQGQRNYVFQTSWGVSTRLIGGLIMIHGDDFGLVLPPSIAPFEIVVLPLSEKELLFSRKIEELLRDFRVTLDGDFSKTLGERIYKWEKKGVPIRLEIGPREERFKKVLFSRRDGREKEALAYRGLAGIIKERLEGLHLSLQKRAKAELEKIILPASSWQEFQRLIRDGKAVYAYWCGNPLCEEKIQQLTTATSRCLPFSLPSEIEKNLGPKRCVYCGGAPGEAKPWIFAQAY